MTALGGRGLEQSPAGPAFEVWRQTLLEELSGVVVPNPDWIQRFHGGRVDMPLIQAADAPRNYDWPEAFGCAIFPSVWQSEDHNICDSNFPLAITTALYYKESGQRRLLGEADVYDAIWYLSAAAMSQRKLTWKASWPTPTPPGITAGVHLAVRRLPTDPVSFTSFDLDDGCATVAFLDVAWELKILTC